MQGGKTMKLIHQCSNVSNEHCHIPNAQDHENTHGLSDEDANSIETPSRQGEEDTPEYGMQTPSRDVPKCGLKHSFIYIFGPCLSIDYVIGPKSYLNLI
jgi:hypothetical protein